MNPAIVCYQCELCDYRNENRDLVVNHLNTQHKDTVEEQRESSFWKDAHAVSVCYDINEDTSTATTSNITWTEEMTKLLLNLYRDKKPLVEKGKIRTSKLMWNQIVDEMSPYGYNLTSLQVENKWKSLERMYKNIKQNTKRTGRGRKTCPYERELDEILSGRHTINPVYTIESSNNALEMENNISHNESESNRSTPEPNTKPVRCNAVQKELQNLRLLIEDKHKKMEKHEELRYQQRNDIIEQMKIRNELLKKLTEKL